MARVQAIVQLTDDLVELLDRRAAEAGTSRSAIIRELLAQALGSDVRAEAARRLRAAYEKEPQSDAADQWGDLDAWTEANARRNLAALDEEEKTPW